MDLDHFKTINDCYGHSVGDDALRMVGSTIQDNLVSGDAAVRYGGEEFLLILRNVALDDAAGFAERLRQKIAAHNVLARNVFEGDRSCYVTASFGVAKWQLSEDFHDVFRRADRALYHAKETGRNRVEVAGRMVARVAEPDLPELRAAIAAT
jgi:diguanylate cyclase (GGDEF)-like protein